MFHSIKRTFFWLSGAGTETLEACPTWEQRKYVAFGATVLVPTAFAFLACSYALSTITDNAMVIYPVALVWALIILTIDRALLASYRPFLSWWRKLGQFALRLCVAVLMGLTIAHPLVLLLFRDTITAVIEEERAAEIEMVRDGFGESKREVRGEISGLEAKVADQRERWNETFQAEFIIQEREDADAARSGLSEAQREELDRSIAQATESYRERLEKTETQIDELTPTFTKLQTELDFWQTEYERELNGQRSGLVGEGPRARSIMADQLEPRRAESQRVSSLLEGLSREKTDLRTRIADAERSAVAAFESKLAEIESANRAEAERVADLKRRVEEDQAETFVTQQNALRDTIRQQIDSLLAEIETTREELAAVATQERERIAGLKSEPRRDILTQTLALHGMFEKGGEGGRFALGTYLVLTMLFMLVDTIPLIVKFFTKPGPYDRLLDRDETSFDSEHQAFRQSNSRYMERLADGNLIALTRNKQLESALVEGVEQSRAAREFLDSLIAMERSFAEQMRLEQEENANSGPEKLAALEAMKTRFYEDLHRRMEVFFSRDQIAAK